MPPFIENSSPAIDEILSVDLPIIKTFVIVYDPDEGEELEYLWTISGFGKQGNATEFIGGTHRFGSELDIPANPDYDGRTLTCTVYDSFDSSDQISWPIEILAEDP